jgi:hypothetical protein
MNLPRTRPLLLALAGLAVAACDGGSGPDQAGPPAHLDIVSGDLQTAVVGTELPQALVVEVTDDKGKPVEGQVVNFVVTAGGGTVFAGTALTNAEGRAQERWTLGTTARDTQRVEARAVNPSTGQALVFAAFRAVGTPGAPAALVKVGGDAQTGAPGVALADSLAVRVTDAHGNGISGQSVAFAAAGGGSVSPATRTTGADGVARAAWTLGTNLGTAQTAAATFAGVPAVGFTATQVASGTLTRTGGVTQTGTAGAVLLDSLEVRFTTPTGAPIQGAVIQWNGPGVLAPATSTTGPDGYARTSWRLPAASGSYQATATLSGAPEMLAFSAVANPGAPAALARVGGDDQMADPGAAVADSLAVRVKDAHGNLVQGAAVTFSASGGGSVSPATATTGADGIARTRWTLGTNVSLAQTVTATVASLPAVTFTATTTGSGVLTRTGGNAQADSIGAFLADSLEVTFTTAAGLPIQGATIQWAASGLDGAVSPETSTTGADGTARTRWRLGTTSGNQFVTAQVAGQNGVLPFSAIARPGAPDTMDVVSVTPESAPLGTVRTVLVVVRDRALNRVPAATVQWSIVCGGPVSPATSQTDANGFATTQWTVNNACSSSPSGPNGSATVAGAGTVQFAALVSGATPARVEIVPDSVTVALNGSLRLEHELYDAFGNYIQPYEDCRYTCYHGFTWTFTNTSVATFGGYVDEDVQTPINVNLVGEGTTLVIVSKGSLADTAVVTVTGASGAASRSPAPLRRATPGARQATPAATPRRPRGRED